MSVQETFNKTVTSVCEYTGDRKYPNHIYIGLDGYLALVLSKDTLDCVGNCLFFNTSLYGNEMRNYGQFGHPSFTKIHVREFLENYEPRNDALAHHYENGNVVSVTASHDYIFVDLQNVGHFKLDRELFSVVSCAPVNERTFGSKYTTEDLEERHKFMSTVLAFLHGRRGHLFSKGYDKTDVNKRLTAEKFYNILKSYLRDYLNCVFEERNSKSSPTGTCEKTGIRQLVGTILSDLTEEEYKFIAANSLNSSLYKAVIEQLENCVADTLKSSRL